MMVKVSRGFLCAISDHHYTVEEEKTLKNLQEDEKDLKRGNGKTL